MDVGKREDQLLDCIAEHIRLRNEANALIMFYMEGKLLSEEVGGHLFDTLNGVVVPEAVEVS